MHAGDLASATTMNPGISAIVLAALGIVALGVFVLWLMGSPQRREREAKASVRPGSWTVTITTPALLVPTLLAGLVAGLPFALGIPPLSVSENPLPVGARGDQVTSNGLVLVGIAMLVAGYVGLLQAWFDGRKPDGRQFVRGMIDHTLTFLLAKLLICLWVAALAGNLGSGKLDLVLYLVPSLLLAPLLGTAALHPRRPFHALRAALERSSWDMFATSKRLCAQTVLLVVIWVVETDLPLQNLVLLAQDASTLSFNPYPILSYADVISQDSVITILKLVSAMVLSTVFMQSYFRRVMEVPNRPGT